MFGINLPNIRPAAVARPFLTLTSRTQQVAKLSQFSRGGIACHVSSISTGHLSTLKLWCILHGEDFGQAFLHLYLYVSSYYLRSKLALQLSILLIHVPLLSVFYHDASPLVLLKISCLVDGKLKQEESILELWSTQTVQARLR
jgi:hypothetical protein